MAREQPVEGNRDLPSERRLAVDKLVTRKSPPESIIPPTRQLYGGNQDIIDQEQPLITAERAIPAGFDALQDEGLPAHDEQQIRFGMLKNCNKKSMKCVKILRKA